MIPHSIFQHFGIPKSGEGVLTKNIQGTLEWKQAGTDHNLTDHADVVIDPEMELSEGNVLQYSETLGKWTNTNLVIFTNLHELYDVTILTPTSGQVLTYNGTVWTNSAPSGGIGGSGTANYVPLFTPNGTTLGNSVIRQSSNSIGIGVAPDTTYKLDLGIASTDRIRAGQLYLEAPYYAALQIKNSSAGWDTQFINYIAPYPTVWGDYSAYTVGQVFYFRDHGVLNAGSDQLSFYTKRASISWSTELNKATYMSFSAMDISFYSNQTPYWRYFRIGYFDGAYKALLWARNFEFKSDYGSNVNYNMWHDQSASVGTLSLNLALGYKSGDATLPLKTWSLRHIHTSNSLFLQYSTDNFTGSNNSAPMVLNALGTLATVTIYGTRSDTALNISNGYNVNGITLGAATDFGSNNNVQEKWALYCIGRPSVNGDLEKHSFYLKDLVNSRTVFTIDSKNDWYFNTQDSVERSFRFYSYYDTVPTYRTFMSIYPGNSEYPLDPENAPILNLGNSTDWLGSLEVYASHTRIEGDLYVGSDLNCYGNINCSQDIIYGLYMETRSLTFYDNLSEDTYGWYMTSQRINGTDILIYTDLVGENEQIKMYNSSGTAQPWGEGGSGLYVNGALKVGAFCHFDSRAYIQIPFIGNFTTTERDAITGLANGVLIYNSTTNKFQGYANGSWVDLH